MKLSTPGRRGGGGLSSLPISPINNSLYQEPIDGLLLIPGGSAREGNLFQAFIEVYQTRGIDC